MRGEMLMLARLHAAVSPAWQRCGSFLLMLVAFGLSASIVGCGGGETRSASYSQLLDEKREIQTPATRAQALLDLLDDSTVSPTDAEIESTLFYATKACDEIANPRRQSLLLVRIALHRQQRSDRQATREVLSEIETAFAKIDEPYDQVQTASALAPTLSQELDSQRLADKLLNVAEQSVSQIENAESRVQGELELAVAYHQLDDAEHRDPRWQQALHEIDQLTDPRQRADALIEVAAARTRLQDAEQLSPDVATAFRNALSAVEAIDDPTSRAFAALALIQHLDARQQTEIRRKAIDVTRTAAKSISGQTSRDSILRQLEALK